jgi:putative ABC transport system permease protein
MNGLSQTVRLLRMSLLSLGARLGPSLVVIVGMAGVVAVLMTMIAVGTSFDRTLRRSGHSDRAIVLRKGAVGEIASVIERDSLDRIADAPGVKHGEVGALISAEALSGTKVHQRAGGAEAYLQVRGIGIASPWIRPELRMVAGRYFRPGALEMIVGRTAQRHYRELELGRTVAVGGTEWIVVGVFETGGDLRESNALVDGDTLLSSTHGGSFSSVTVRLQSPQAFSQFKAALTSDPSLAVDVYRESEYFDQRADGAQRLFKVLLYGIGGIMMIGAIFAAANTMFATVSSRSKEIATLRAIGYRPIPTVLATLAESALLATAGALCGAALAWSVVSGRAFSPSVNGGQIGQSIFELNIGAGYFVAGALLACLLGLAGGLLPALRAARGPVATAFRKS